jgi:hypothetical protein
MKPQKKLKGKNSVYLIDNMLENNPNNMAELLSNSKIKSVNDSCKTLIEASLTHRNGQKITYKQLINE